MLTITAKTDDTPGFDCYINDWLLLPRH
uniref:Uncharacterized protein n=1 Tax=Anguilla anguilla TaxID=7936 RepID=A0A0E9UER6_ANGAN